MNAIVDQQLPIVHRGPDAFRSTYGPKGHVVGDDGVPFVLSGIAEELMEVLVQGRNDFRAVACGRGMN